MLMAGSAGTVMSRLLVATDAESLAAANDRGVAMQITNALRDVGQDLRRGRIYLREEVWKLTAIHRASSSEERAMSRSAESCDRLLNTARGYYDSGMRGIPRLDRSVQFSVYLAATLYGRILDKIEEHDFTLFTRRASFHASEKWMLTMPTYLALRHLYRKHP